MTESGQYEAAWAALRWRFVVQYAVVAVTIAALMAKGFVSQWLQVDAGVVIVVCIVAILGLNAWIYRFPCPRCGQLFRKAWPPSYRPWQWDYLRTCQHCGLRFNEIPRETP